MRTFFRVSSVLSYLAFYAGLVLVLWAYITHHYPIMNWFIFGSGVALLAGFGLDKLAHRKSSLTN